MKTIFGIENLKKPLKKTVITIGAFDGVHIGHKLIIKKVIQKARRINGKAIVMTFDPHPLQVLKSEKRPPRIMSLAHRLDIFKRLGVDICIVVRFDKNFSNIMPEKFIKQILVEKLNAKAILIGENFLFGKDRKGSISILKKLGKIYNFSVESIEPIKVGNKIASSTLIRELISKGDLSNAVKLLGRLVSILGTVVRGDRRGRIIGYPTANIDPHHEVIPPSGVYAVKIRLQNKLFSGIVNIGKRPTFKLEKDAEPTIEVHIFNFNRNLYGKDLEILFIKKIRDEKRFLSQEDLVKQIRKDEVITRKIL